MAIENDAHINQYLMVVPPPTMQHNGLMCAAIIAQLPPYQQSLVRSAGHLGATSYQDAIDSGLAVGAFVAVGKKVSEVLRYAPLISPDRCPTKWRSYGVTLVVDMRRVSRELEKNLHSTILSSQDPNSKQIVVHEMKIMHWSYPRSIMRLGRVIKTSRLIIGAPRAPRYPDEVTQFPEKFLSGLFKDAFVRHQFTLLDLSGLSTSFASGIVPPNFLSETSLPASIDLSPLFNIRHIWSKFMFMCEIVSEIDFNPILHLETIGDNFMNAATGLKHITMSKLTKLEKIGSHFMDGCKNLQTVHLCPESTIQDVGFGFLQHCPQLSKFDVTPLRKMTRLPPYFMAGCSKLVEMDLPPLTSITITTTVGSCAFKSSTNYKMLINSIDLAPLSNVTTISTQFLMRCEALVHLDFSPMVRVEVIGECFLCGCIRLKSVNLSGLGLEVSSIDIGKDFMGFGSQPLLQNNGYYNIITISSQQPIQLQ